MKKVVASLLCAFLPLFSAFAAVPAICGNYIVRPTSPLLLFDSPLPGTAGRVEGSARVEIRALKNAGIRPVSEQGESDETANPLFQVDHVGTGLLSSTPTGDFDIVLDPSIITNQVLTNFFVRVYNSDSAATAAYYFDSNPFQCKLDNINLSIKVPFSAPKSIRSNSDLDGDGLTDNEETSGLFGYRTNPYKDDTDGDGLRDDVEVAYGLDPTKPLEIVLTSTPSASRSSLSPSASDWLVGWQASTSPYVSYTLEMVQDLLDIQEGDFPSAAAAQRVVRSSNHIKPDMTNWTEIVTEWMQTNRIGFFRVRQDLQPLPVNDASGETGKSEANGVGGDD